MQGSLISIMVKRFEKRKVCSIHTLNSKFLFLNQKKNKYGRCTN
jgi:hypothetical protein